MAQPLADQASELRKAICHSRLLPQHRIGMSVVAVTGFLSASAVIVLLAYTIRNHIQLRRLELAGPTRRSSTFFRTHVDFYMLSLLFADLLQGLGAMVNIEWIRGSQCYCGTLCRTQGILQVLGESGVAMSTLAICFHTFVVVFFGWHPPAGRQGARIWGTVLGVIWTYLGLCVSVGFVVNQNKASRSRSVTDMALQDFYAPTPFWCWIGQGYIIERIVFEYMWLWSTALISILLYSILFLRMRGYISVDPRKWTRIQVHLRPSKSDDLSFVAGPNGTRLRATTTNAGHLVIKQETRDALKFLYYPAAYTALVFPLSVARWTSFHPSDPPDLSRTAANTPFTATAIVLCIFGLSGLVNVVMFVSTRPNVLGFGARRQARAEKLRLEGAGAIISSFGSIAPISRDVNGGGGSNMRNGGGVLITQHVTRSTTGLTPVAVSPGRFRPGGHALGFDVPEDSEYELSDIEDDGKRRSDLERMDAPQRLAPLPPAHTFDTRQR